MYHPSLTATDIAQNNACYATMTENTHWKYFLQNIKLTHEYLVNNTEETLVTEVNETYQ